MTLAYLEALKKHGCVTTDELQIYCRQFYTVLTNLVERGLLDLYMQGVWFLQGLPPKTSAKIISKQNVDINNPKTINFANFLQATGTLYTTIQTVQDFYRSTY